MIFSRYMLFTTILLTIAHLGNAQPGPTCDPPQVGTINCEDELEVLEVVTNITPTNDSGMSGTITFTEVDGIVTMVAEVTNVSPPGDHAIHIHAIGNCSADNGTSAGGHWNPTNEDHGTWGIPPFHRGDIGNIFIEDGGTGTISRATDLWCIGCGDPVKDILGKAIIIHEGPDDFSSQPSGAAGPRIGCAEIGDCVPITWYEDADGDGLGNPAITTTACDRPTGFVSNGDDDDEGRPPVGGNPIDCDDPGAGPRCCGDGICDGPETEENCPEDCGPAICEGTLDECGVCDGPGPATWYEDADGDNLGNPDVSQQACEQPTGYVAYNTDDDDTVANIVTLLDVESSYFTAANENITVTRVSCTLSDGTETECYEIVTNSTPTDHQMGPWCPDNIADDATAGGIWLDGGEVYDVDGAFIENLASFYNDNTWQMYDANGDIYTTETQQECIEAANPNVGDTYQNFCVECLPSYITGLSQTWLLPVTPVQQASPAFFAMGPGGMGNNIPSTRGLALNGVEYSAPAPVNNILSAYTLAPFDDAGGHINVNQGYHYHAATGVSYSIAQSDGHAPLIGYALDGYGIYALLDEFENEPTGLDDCRGQYDDIRGYHYHIDAAGNNNFINCLQGAYAVSSGAIIEEPIDEPMDTLISTFFFNSSLISFEPVTATLEDGTSADCFEITFSSNPVEGGPFCPETIDDVAGMGFYDGATNPGLRVFAADLLNDIEADGYNMVNDDGTVNVFDFSGGMPDNSVSNCLAAAPNDNLQLTFIIPAVPKLAASNNVIREVELIGLSLDGVPINGDPPSATSGPMMGGPGGGQAAEINFPSLDPCGGHHDPAGYYHWHFIPEVVNQVLESNGITEIACTEITQTTEVQLAGFAKDGFPIYAYADEPIDLDDCGGRTAATNEFPDGVYHYVASTTTAANVPTCLKGVAASNAFSYQ